jgi:hypothetical protein
VCCGGCLAGRLGCPSRAAARCGVMMPLHVYMVPEVMLLLLHRFLHVLAGTYITATYAQGGVNTRTCSTWSAAGPGCLHHVWGWSVLGRHGEQVVVLALSARVHVQHSLTRRLCWCMGHMARVTWVVLIKCHDRGGCCPDLFSVAPVCCCQSVYMGCTPQKSVPSAHPQLACNGLTTSSRVAEWLPCICRAMGPR